MTDDFTSPSIEIGWVCFDCKDPERLAAWWQALIGGETSVDGDGDVHLDGGAVPLLFLGVPEEKSLKNRLHLDLRVEDFEAAVARARSLGAQLADDIFTGERWRVFRDPEGNEFCIMRPKIQSGQLGAGT
jgi:predicted enzyme related to lactoylglutathione lyase